MVSNVLISLRFETYLLDWDYRTYLTIGGYGSGKSYNNALKIHLKLLKEKRTCLVVRNVFDTIRDSCYSLFREIIENMGQLETEDKKKSNKVVFKVSPLEVLYPNGSKIIFRGLDKVEKVKSIHGVSIVWIEECSEIKFDAYLELLGRVRSPGNTLHFILSCNPVGIENWVYKTFFVKQDEQGNDIIIQDPEEFYEKRTLIKYDSQGNGIYYHHSVVDDNPFINKEYVQNLESLKELDEQLWLVARWGRFGVAGLRVLPRFRIAKDPVKFKQKIYGIPSRFHFFGFDFGFETSYNALMSCCVDDLNKILYIYDEIYMNQITDDLFCKRDDVQAVNEKAKRMHKNIIGDSAEPKTIRFYQQQGFNMVKCTKYAGSRLENIKKIKRFKEIVCSPKCKNCIRELQNLTYKKDSHGMVIYDEFNIDPHTLFGIMYSLDHYTVADVKEQKTNSRRG